MSMKKKKLKKALVQAKMSEHDSGVVYPVPAKDKNGNTCCAGAGPKFSARVSACKEELGIKKDD